MLAVGSIALAARQVDVGSVRARYWTRAAKQPLSAAEREALERGGDPGPEAAWKLLAQELPAPEGQVVGWLSRALEQEPGRWPWALDLARSRPQQVRLLGAGVGLGRFRPEASRALAELRVEASEVDGLALVFLSEAPDPWTSAQLDLRAYHATGYRPPGWPQSLVQALLVSPADARGRSAEAVLSLFGVRRGARHGVGTDALAAAYARAEQACQAPQAWDCALALGELAVSVEEDRLSPSEPPPLEAALAAVEVDLPPQARPLADHVSAWAAWVAEAEGADREDRLLLASRLAYPVAHHEASAAMAVALGQRVGMKVEVRQVGSTLVLEAQQRSWLGERCRPVAWTEGRLPGGAPSDLPPWWVGAAVELREAGHPFLAVRWLGQAAGAACPLASGRAR
jgi:hypothetical protein